MLEQFSRTELLLGPEAMKRLGASRVAVFGLGGVGSYACEALARCGIGALDVIDHDRISLSNINRQAIATLDTVGQEKAQVMAARIKSINPECQVRPKVCFYLPATADEFDFRAYDYVIDAVDTVTGKLLIIQQAQGSNTPVISSMGTANKLDPTAFKVGDIFETSIDPLAKIIRKECRKRGIKSLKVLYSTEPPRPLYPEENPEVTEENANLVAESEAIDALSAQASRHGIPGSCAFVPPVAGLIIASAVIKDLAGLDG